MGKFRKLIRINSGLLCLVLILLLTGGCDNISTLLEKGAALLQRDSVGIKIPSGPEVVTREHFDRLHYSWMYRNTVEAYHKSSLTPKDYDQQAVAFLDRISQIESHIETNPDWQDVMIEGSSLLRAGCRHPLISLWYGVAMFKNNRIEGAESVLMNLRSSLPNPEFPASQGFFLARTMLEIIHYRLGDLDRVVPGKFELLISSLADGLRNKEFFDVEARVCYRLVKDFSRDLDYPKIWERLHKALAATTGIDLYLILMARGEAAIHDAWTARGYSWAAHVTEEGWEGFRSNMAIAREVLVKAWTLNPDYPEAPARMVNVAMAGHAGPDESTAIWFNRSVSAQIDYNEAYSNYFFSLLPRWGGDYQQILDAGLKCLETERFDTDVPMYYLVALRTLGIDQKFDRWRLPFRTEYAVANLDKLFKGMLADKSRAKDKDRIITQQALVQLWRGNYGKAGALLNSIDKKVDLRNGFAGKPLSWSYRSWDDIETELTLFTGPDKANLQTAEEHNLAGRGEESHLVLIRVIKKYVNEPAKYDYLRERIGFQMIDVFPAPSHYTALHIAAGEGDLETMDFLIDNGADINARNKYGFTPLNYAVVADKKEAAKKLIAAGADINIASNDGGTPLYNACLTRSVELATLLIDKKADIHRRDTYGITALHAAVMYELPDIVKTLISQGADINARNIKGMTTIHYAIRGEDEEMTKLLLELGAAPNLEEYDGTIPLIYLISTGNIRLAEYLAADPRIDVNVQAEGQWTPLHYAAYYGYEKLARILLGKGAETGSRLASGETPLQIARLNRRKSLEKVLSGYKD